MMDVLLLTIINAGACLALPKLLSMVSVRRAKQSQPLSVASTCKPTKEITSFPYCTTHSLTGSQFCKFKPRFCSQCSLS
ncbi:hypothetical protein [Dolichospermum circinale]|uniref:hypothetical protein n=1 Tax=Dolichospermum circinale TaxID=109265 RepID=UPI001E5F7B6B|nr:hypothetical protein [Dolichospermum circinale]MDB9475712.1 hypothetical protein [Dolichospermum circinale CS-537/11]MDB9478164.1 hypothetical protein [Dolichospermum circinale CS-537/03]MDB9483741.1 hypothetical protein [Dolichospermum circinale CS-537/05]